ncbi:TRAP transporter small permease subunit [Thiomicrospira sp. R3]|uniref:TRAP transporter small permease subunit n=1 Tax=Thiomicrospira sp. R3 TaxID=3035472 RepID=UPI00259B95F0|nr:TRAP transporter small permease subunit [Thiomicrospira sp. R3]WFE69241.1 TRAP transporter small permease subunit [Thiomicrospira sp. R3]
MTIFKSLNLFILWQNRLQRSIGQGVAWLALLLVLATSAAVFLRYGFDFSSSKLDETLVYIHASLFMLGIAYTYQQNQHVRVDVFYQRLSPRHQAWVNLLGALLFVLPVMGFIIWSGLSYVGASWAIQEKSIDASGLAYVYLLKTLILIMPGLVLLQALSFIAQYLLELFAPDPLAEGA